MLVSIKYINFTYIGKIYQFKIEPNNMIMLLYPYIQNHYIYDLMLYFLIYVVLIQKTINYSALKDYVKKEDID